MYLVRSELFPLLSARCAVDCPDGASAWPSQKSTSSGSPSSLRLWICPAVLRSRSSCEHLHRTDVAARTLPERKDTCTNCVRLPGRGDSRPRCPSPRRPSILHVSVPVKGLFFFWHSASKFITELACEWLSLFPGSRRDTTPSTVRWRRAGSQQTSPTAANK